MWLKDERGKRYGRLEVVDRFDITKRPDYMVSTTGAYWLCRCDCGRETIAYGGNLRSGKTKSCGCLRVEVTGERSRRRRNESGETCSGLE